LTAKRGTAKSQADQTGEPTAPGRTQARQPKADTERAKAEASANEPNGTNRQAGAGCHPAPAGKARRAHTQPQDSGRATTPATRREPTTETKPDINTPKNKAEGRKRTEGRPQNHNPKKKKKKKRKNAFLKQAENLWSQGGELLGILICDAFPQIRSPYSYYLDGTNFWFTLSRFLFLIFLPLFEP